jgi:uncharacterized protein YodC (DUF2158 family)
MEKPATGSVIYLKVGSPPMVVNSQRCDTLISAEWFAADGTLQRDSFDPENIFMETPELEHLRMQRSNNMQAFMRDGRIVVGEEHNADQCKASADSKRA